MKIKQDQDYKLWYLGLTIKEQVKISKRLNNIKKYDHLGDCRHLENKLYELRWKNGWRVYFIKVSDLMILLVGGHKNDQEKDIKKAKINVERYTRNRNR